MKTLRIARNVAALFILAMGLMSFHSRVALAAGSHSSCGFRVGYSGCRTGANGQCKDTICNKKVDFCLNFGCI